MNKGLLLLVFMLAISGIVSAYDTSCEIDNDCRLDVPSDLSKCLLCDSYSCRIYDGSENVVVAVNKNWYPDCPEVNMSNMICPTCIGGINSINYSARCIENQCTKLLKSEACNDSDGGEEYYIKGTVTYRDESRTDYCDNFRSYNLIEYVCSENVDGTYDIVWKGYNCSNGCLDGVCLKEAFLLDAEYFLVEEEEKLDYDFYVSPSYPEVEHLEIYITVVLEGIDEENNVASVKVLSNDPNNRFFKEFEYDKYLEAYNTGKISSSDLERYDKIKIRLRYGDEIKEIIDRTSSLNIKWINRIDPSEEEKPIKIPVEEVPEEIEKEVTHICQGCLLNEKCYPLGYRKSGEYCSDELEFVEQSEEGASCENNFECKSNVCVDDKCVSGSLIQKIIEWFKRLFGIE